jgi:DNA-binding GntR family transcriptional regulator
MARRRAPRFDLGRHVPPVRTAGEHVYEHLREAILAGRLRGGERIDQDVVARQLGVSRMPVREAIRRLDSEGFVTNRANRAAVVTALGPEEMLELFEMRSVLEGLAVSLALRRVDHRVFAELEEQVRRMQRAETRISAWVELHDGLHDAICRLAQRPRLVALVRNLRHAAAPYLRLYLSAYRHAEMPGFEHQTLLQAIRGGDVAAAAAAMREHVMSAASGVGEFVRKSEVLGPPAGWTRRP